MPELNDSELLDGVSYMYGGGNEENLSYYSIKVITTRKDQKCNSYYHDNHLIPKGSKAIAEKGFLDSKPVSCYTCVDCAMRAFREWKSGLSNTRT